MAKDYNSAKSNTSTSVKSGSEGGGKALEEFSASPGGDHHSSRSNTTEASSGGDHNSSRSNTTEASPGGNHNSSRSNTTEASPRGDYHSTRSNRTSIEIGGDGKDPIPDKDKNYNSAKSNTSTAVKSGGGGGTTGLGTTLGLVKTGFVWSLAVVVLAAGADLYKTYDDNVSINLEEHVTDAEFKLTNGRTTVEGTIGFDVPKMGLFEKRIKVQIHLTILESNPTTEDDFYFEHKLGGGEEFYDFILDDLDPVTQDKIDKEEPLDLKYDVTITVVYLGIELSPTSTDVGSKTTTMQTTAT